MKSIKLKVFAHNNCGSGPCPTVFQSEDGRFFVQGYTVAKEISDQIEISENELLVEIDEALIKNIIKNGS